MLLEDGCTIRLGDIIGEGTVTEDDGCVARGVLSSRQAAMPSARASTSSASIVSAKQTNRVPAPTEWTG